MACFTLHNFSLFFALPGFVAAQSANISSGSFLVATRNSSPWHSPSKDFAFGFRSIGDQNLFQLAIWFDAIPDKTVVWYANQSKPAPEGSKVELGADGQFILTTSRGEEIWKPVADKVDYAALLNTGNFIIADNKTNHIWESFSNPTDTILPSQVMERGGLLSSRRAQNRYEKGSFQLRLLPDGNLVLNPIALPTEKAYDAYYISGTYDPANDTNSGFRLVFNETGYLYVVRRNENIKNLTSGQVFSPRDFYYRATLDVDGVFTQYDHPKSPTNGGNWIQTWAPVWFVPRDICSAIKGDLGGGVCGFNSICTLQSDTGRPVCECLPGFSLLDQDDKFSSCKPDNVQTCDPSAPNPEELYETKTLLNLVWRTSANYEELQPSNEEDCRKSCISDCHCVVAVTYNGTCWKKKLPLSIGTVDISTYGKNFIKLPRANLTAKPPPTSGTINQKDDQETAILVISILLGSSVFLNLIFMAASSIAFFCSYHKRQNRTGMSSILETNLRSFTFEDLKKGTDGFRDELGRGAFGTVYKGILSSPSSTTLIAVKRLDNLLKDGEKEFVAEASAIAKTHHKNLVRLLGFCDEGQNKLLVYEFMSNGTLANFLFGISKPDWNRRVQIAFGIARGLAYLHEECGAQVIHCDIKPQNILLDDSFTARISDFGLAKLLMNEQTRTLTAIRGTRGYVAPEWFRNMPITAKVDVYSFGVMLLEIVCCRKSLELERENEEEAILVDWVYDCYKYRRLGKLVENDEEAKNDMKRLERLVMVAIWCIQEDPSLRPSMKRVTQMLEGVVQVSVPPCPCPFSSLM